MKRRGVILLYALTVVGLVMFVMTLFLQVYKDMQRWSMRDRDALLALTAAQAGIDDAMFQLSKDVYWEEGFAAETLGSGASYSMTFDPAADPHATSNVRGQEVIYGQDGRYVPVGWVHLVSVGKYHDVSKRFEALINLTSGSVNLVRRW